MANLKTYLAAAFKEEEPVSRFLQSFFKTPDEFIFYGDKVQIDAVRGKEEYAVDVKKNAGGRGNEFNIFTRKEYEPPEYDEYAYVTAAELNKILPGQTIYDNVSNPNAYTRDLAMILMDRLNALRNKIIRSKELQCRDALFFGKITLINGDEIDFKQKATHVYTTPTAWTAAGDPFADFGVLGQRVRKDGVREIVDAVFGSTALSKFLNNAVVKAQGDKFQQLDRMSITSPIARDQGAKYHGTFSAEDYKLNIWSYPQFVGIPTGFGLPNAGTKQPYIPVDRIVVLPDMPDFRLFYAGIPSLTNNVSAELAGFTGLNQMPSIERGKMIPYAFIDNEARAIKLGVRSRPLAVPVEIDGYGVMIVT